MSNGDPNTVQVIYRDIFGTGKSSALTSRDNEVILKLVKMHILEMEDVLFHLNSAVMMPENPQGESSTQGGGAGEEQIKVSGIKALALVFKQFEFDPEVKMVVSGHTDTSGTAEFNFKLSKERALNILYLIYKKEEEDSRKKWAEICYNRHKVEDYQQILTYFEKKLACGCDPQGIDDDWGDNTKKATENFLTKMGLGNVKVKSTLYEIETDQKKRWPVSIWELVYDLYSKEIYEVLEITNADLESRRNSSVKFVDDDKKIVSCGESFPIDQKEKSNYRSQKNRRVELLFFDNDEIPKLTCPADIKNTHKEEDCPLWRKFYFVPLYIDPADLKSVAYHLQFVYYDKIKKKQLPLPAGLIIKAYEDGHKEIPSETVFKDGIYFLKVQFKNKIKDPARTQFYFEYETADQWVYTKDDKTDPVIVTKTADEIKKLNFIERHNYYDLPVKWSSRNYFTRDQTDSTQNGKFEIVFKDTLKLKPLGDKTTTPDKPLVFSLDDIVLTELTKSQILSDKNPAGNPIPLDENSRYTIFHIDYDTMEAVEGKQKNLRRIKIYNPEVDQPVFTDFKFIKNLITDVPAFTRIVYFCNDYYDVGYKRSSQADTSFDLAKGHVTGARLAIKNDPDLHIFKKVIGTDATDTAKAYALDSCGNFELHYFHNCAELDGKALNFLIIYWSCRFVQNAVDPWGTAMPASTAADVTNHRKFGMVNAMNRLNKNYLIEKNSGSEDIFIRPFHFMEAKNDTNGGQHKAAVNIVGNTPDPGAWMRINDSQFRARDYQADPNYFSNTDAINNLQDVDGATYAVLTNHHEMGHATGNWDDYLYNFEDAAKNDWSSLPRYNQPFTAVGGPYRCDELSRMYHNRTPRLRNFWKFVLWLNDESAAGKSLNNFLKGTKYKITFKGTSHKHEFFLADSYRNVSIASKREIDHSIDAVRKLDLLLYKLGDDELSRMLKAGTVFNGILVVKIRLALRFINAGTGWNFANSLAWAQQLNNDFQSMLDKKYRITTNTNNDFKNIYVVFTPSYQVYTGGGPANSQFNIEVTWQHGNNFNTAGKTMSVDWDTNRNRIIRYIFGLTTGTNNLTNTNFSTVVNWIGSAAVGNATYTMYNL